jgi:hypothetical protein
MGDGKKKRQETKLYQRSKEGIRHPPNDSADASAAAEISAVAEMF